jgi:DNA modification methylase
VFCFKYQNIINIFVECEFKLMIKPFNEIQNNITDIEQSILDIDNKKRANLYTWNGQFSPQFVEGIIDKYVKQEDCVFDPFMGSGTVLYECARKNIAAIGVELNPSAYYMSKSYELCNLDLIARNDLIFYIDGIICALNDNLDLIKQLLSAKCNKEHIDNTIDLLIILLDIYKNDVSVDIIQEKWDKLKSIIVNLPNPDKKIKALMGDARYTNIDSANIDVVVTSPPYINVFNYHQNYRRSVEALGYDVLKIAKSEFGSNRKNRSNRYLTVVQYCVDMALSFKEIVRICKEKARIIMVVGKESNVLSLSFCNSELIYEIGCEIFGLDFLLKQQRVFKNKFGKMIYEDILHFSVNKKGYGELEESDIIRKAKNISKNMMLKNIAKVGSDFKNLELLKKAIKEVDLVDKSEVIMSRGVHGEKLVALLQSSKLPIGDKKRVEEAIQKYDKWVAELKAVQQDSMEDLIKAMVRILNDYKLYIDIELIFDSEDDFLYRQKGQLKLDNTVIEEFLPIFVKKCIEKRFGKCEIQIDSQTPVFSSVYFNSSLSNPGIGGGLNIKTKDQDFSMSRKLYLKSSYSQRFESECTNEITTHIGYILAELKTNLDKTMFQEASATAHDVKLAVTGAKYYLLCDFLDMKPISTATTDIDEILILRKAKRINSNIRSKFSTYKGRQELRQNYIEYLCKNPYSVDMFTRLVEHIFSQLTNEELIEEDILNIGYF